MSKYKVKGIDVSRHQGNIDWNSIKASGIAFAIIKAGGSDDGFYTDANFEKNYKEAKRVGIPVGAYYFVGRECKSIEDGRADAQRFLKMLKGKQFEYPVYMDVESTRPSDKKGVTQAAIAFCETLENAGYYTGIYASDISGFKDRLDIDLLKDYDFWVAKYSAISPRYAKPYGIWQYTSKGKLAGVSSKYVDFDYSYKNYPAIIIHNRLNGFTKPKPNKPAKPPVKPVHNFKKGTRLNLKGVQLYSSAYTSKASKKLTGTYYIYDGVKIGKRYRITNAASRCGKTPIWRNVTGFVDVEELV